MNVYLIGMLISMAIYIILGFVISKKVNNANDFYVAGRNAPVILIVGSLVASYCSTGLFMGDAGEGYNGFFAPLIILEAIQVCGYVLGSVFFGRYLRRSNVLTVPEFFEKRFCSRRLGILATSIQIVSLVVYLLSVMQGIGSLMNLVTNLDYSLCILLALITFALLTVTSGAKGVLITDTIMFGIFMVAAIAGVIFIAQNAGGWYNAIQTVTAAHPDYLSWHGNLSHLYSNGMENIIWGIVYGIVWLSVCMIGPWQSSRYLMAKNEHVVVRSSAFAALGVFLAEFTVIIGAVMVNAYSPNLSSDSNVMIWAAMNVMPTILGVVMLTGVLAAGISSATTFLSLIGTSVGNDILRVKDDKKKIRVGRIAIVLTSVIVMVLAYFNPPQIFWIMFLGATVIACSWFPVCIASIWSKKVTKAGAFCGMLVGFIMCAATKIYASVTEITLPIYLDPFIVGVVCNIIAMAVVSMLTKRTPEEDEAYRKMFVVPESEKNRVEVAKSKKGLLLVIGVGIVITLLLVFLWVIPYYKAM